MGWYIVSYTTISLIADPGREDGGVLRATGLNGPAC